jgi:hypothetical protein
MNAMLAGAAAVVIVNSNSEHFPIRALGTTSDGIAAMPIRIPLVMIGKADGDLLAGTVDSALYSCVMTH